MGKVILTNFASYGRLHLTSLDINHLAHWKMAELAVVGADGGGGVGGGVQAVLFQDGHCVIW